MDQVAVKKLNDLNKKFYQEIGDSFDQTRNYYWEGWKVLYDKGYLGDMDRFKEILDIGCGNGRFASFLLDKSVKFKYYGMDSSSLLLEKARKRLGSSVTKAVTLKEIDILDLSKMSQYLDDKSFDLITLFGVMHHIPDNELRKEILILCKKHLRQNGKLIFSIWDFMKDDRFTDRVISPESVGISSSEMDQGDHILDWRKGSVAYRYCHYYSEDEVLTLLKNVGFSLKEMFFCDGRSGRLNRYYVVRGLES